MGEFGGRGVRIHLAAYLAASLLMIGIWLAVAVSVGAWYFWPVWPILGMGTGVLSHAVPVQNWLHHAGFRATS
jgi:2TM domain-containing protein